MRVLGWLASMVGLVGVFACNAVTPLLWVLRWNVRSRARDLLAVPDAGLEAAIALTDRVADWLDDASAGINDIKLRADDLAAAPVVDEASAAALATAIDDFISGPYATLRTVYTGLRDRALNVGETLRGIGRAVPVLEITDAIADRLEAIDARMQEIDASMTTLAQMGAAGLAKPGVAAAVSERANLASEQVQAIGQSFSGIETSLHDGRDRVVAADRRTARALTVGALVGTALTLFVALLNVLLFQQGRRWSRR
jgi:hypothetical protein